MLQLVKLIFHVLQSKANDRIDRNTLSTSFSNFPWYSLIYFYMRSYLLQESTLMVKGNNGTSNYKNHHAQCISQALSRKIYLIYTDINVHVRESIIGL
jgi:hypothetical protein